VNGSPTCQPPDGDRRALTVAYVINGYPAPSHTFIRREIHGLEALGIRVQRFSIRPGRFTPGSSEDAAEFARTRVLLQPGMRGALRLMWSVVVICALRPGRTIRALRLAVRMCREADRGLVHHAAYFAEACHLARLVDGEVGHLHAHFMTNSTTVAMLCAELTGIGYSFTSHGASEFDRSLALRVDEKIARARFVAAISVYGRSQLWRLSAPQDWDKVHIVRCGLEAALLDRPCLPVPDVPELLWIGRLAPEKGLPVLLRACVDLRARGVRFRVGVVGGGELEAWARGELQRLGLADQVELHGWQTSAQVIGLLDRSRGLVQSSFSEGLPVVLMEAFARSRPVVATRIAAIRELVIPGENGWLCDASSSEGLADCMAAMLASPVALLQRMGEAGQARVRAMHAIDREVAKLGALIRVAAGQVRP
jgi:glycosyltransferase involved in cell wall biosynthesis